MVIIDRNEIFERWGKVPQNLKDAIFSDSLSNQINLIYDEFHIPESKREDINYLCTIIFLGFLNRKELYKHLQLPPLSFNKKLALELYGEIDEKIFGPYKNDIDKLFLKFSLGASDMPPKEEVLEVGSKPIEKQVVLKEKESENVVNLRPAGSKLAEIGEPEPVKLNISEELEMKTKEELEEGPRRPESKKESKSEQEKGITVEGETKKSGPDIGGPPKPISSPPPTPLIIHKEEKLETAGGDRKTLGYKDITMGGIAGSLKDPFLSVEQKDVPEAKIEIPSEEQENIQTADKNDEELQLKINKDLGNKNSVKSIHYAPYKTNLDSEGGKKSGGVRGEQNNDIINLTDI